MDLEEKNENTTLSKNIVDTIIYNKSIGETKIALLEDNKLVELHIDRDNKISEGVICLGRIGKKISLPNNSNAFFVDIGDVEPAFLPEKERRIADERLTEGMAVIVQVKQEARDDKGAKLTRVLSFAGDSLVLCKNSGKKGINISSRIKGSVTRDKLTNILSDKVDAENENWIIRTGAVNKSENDIVYEVETLRVRAGMVREGAQFSTPPTILDKGQNFCLYLIAKYKDTLKKIVINEKPAFDEAFDFCENTLNSLSDKLIHHKENKDVFDSYMISESIEEALQPIVKINGGGRLIIEQTRAITAIDVDSGNTGFNNNINDINYAAAKEIARQIRLRNIAGKISIDFAGASDIKFLNKPMDILKEEMKKDFSNCWIAGVSPTGNVELIRTRKKPSLSELMQAKCCICDGCGKSLNLQTKILDMIRNVYFDIKNNNLSDFELTAGINIYEILNNEMSLIWDELQSKTGFNIKVSLDSKLSKSGYEIKEL